MGIMKDPLDRRARVNWLDAVGLIFGWIAEELEWREAA